MNKTKKVDLFIDVSQGMEGKGFDSFKLFTTGKLKKRKEGFVIEYENEYNGISTIFLKENGFVKIKASGDLSYDLKLDEKKITKFSCLNKDSFLYFNVKTKSIFFKFDEDGGQIALSYCLEIDDFGSVLENNLNIKVK